MLQIGIFLHTIANLSPQTHVRKLEFVNNCKQLSTEVVQVQDGYITHISVIQVNCN